MKSDHFNQYTDRIPQKPFKNDGGFTLLEVLISISLLVIVIALAGMAMRMALNAVTAGEKKIEMMERFRSSLHIVSSQIGSEIPLIEESGATKKFIFQGSKNALQIPTGYSIWDGLRGYVVVEYKVIEDGKGKVSLKASENSIGTGKNMETLLFSGLDRISFEYPGKNVMTGDEEKWVEEWQDNKTLPEKIKLNLEYNGARSSFILPLRARKISK